MMVLGNTTRNTTTFTFTPASTNCFYNQSRTTSVHRIDTRDVKAKWQFTCPSPARHSDWRVTNGHFECRSCEQTYKKLYDQVSGEKVPREEIEFVGPYADSMLEFGKPQRGGGDV